MRRRAWALAILCVVLILVSGLLLLLPSGVPTPLPTIEGLRPGQTRRARARKPRPPQVTEPSTTLAGIVELSVYLDDTTWQPGVSRGFTPETASYWPGLDEVPWPDLPSVERLDRVFTEALLSREGQVIMDDFLGQAEDDGLFDLDPSVANEDPWLALLALQANTLDTVMDDLERHGLRWEADADRPAVDFGTSHGLAEAIVTAHPDTAVADYASIFLLTIEQDENNAQYDPENAIDRSLALLETTDDLVLAEAALSTLHVLREQSFTEPDVRAAVEDLLDETSPDVALALIDAALDETLHSDPDEALRWVRHRSEAVAALGERATSRDREAADRLLGRLASQGVGEATTWQSELIAVVWDCHHDRPAVQHHQGRGAWTTSWVPWDWQETSDFTRCLESRAGSVAPEAPTRVSLTITVPGPR